jgi:hypothetical protein
MRTSRKGVAARRSRQTRSVPASGGTASSGQAGRLPSESRNPSKPVTASAKSTTLGGSTRATVCRQPPGGRAGLESRGSQRSASSRPAPAICTLTRKMACHPANVTNTPPTTGPSAELRVLATERTARVPAGGRPCGSREPARIRASAEG